MARLLLSLLLAAPCWVGETTDVCKMTKKACVWISCLDEVLSLAMPDLPARIRSIQISNLNGSLPSIDYQITNIHFEEATNLQVRYVSCGENRDSFFEEEKDVRVNLDWHGIKLAMNVSAKLCLKTGQCRQVIARPTLHFNSATFDKAWRVWIWRNKTTNKRHVAIPGLDSSSFLGLLRLQIGTNSIRDNIKVNSSLDLDQGLASTIRATVNGTWLLNKSYIKKQLSSTMDEWFHYSVLPTLAKKMIP